ncbi:MAG: transglycosylase domain-containing protein [Pelosinus sp.]|nr:transglycosylase domain-containing protein [Pelosinus sp.]
MLRRHFTLILFIVFCTSFIWAGGSTLLKKYIPATTLAFPAPAEHASGLWDRSYRIINLKSAVKAKIDTKNYVHLQDVPITMQQAIIATEDNRFYNHFGLDISSIARALLVNMQTGSIAEGGSTITQQLVKNLFLSQEQNFGRKAEEAVLALDMELRYSKEEILEMYLNTIYFGSGAYGIGDAARNYFAKQPPNLNLAEASLLAGLPNAPSVYSPYVNFSAAKQRQAVVLAAMVKYGYLGPSLADEARTVPIRLAK